jgi:single-strand DNA-binding protein
MNHITIYGNLGKDPEVKTVGEKKVAKFSVATTRRGKDKDGNKITDWHNVILWDKLAELSETYLKKGSSVIIEGELQYRNYENKEGIKVYVTEIVGNQMHFVGKKEPDSGIQAKDEFQGSANKEAIVNKSKEAAENTDDLPFILTIPIAIGFLLQFIG